MSKFDKFDKFLPCNFLLYKKKQVSPPPTPGTAGLPLCQLKEAGRVTNQLVWPRWL